MSRKRTQPEPDKSYRAEAGARDRVDKVIAYAEPGGDLACRRSWPIELDGKPALVMESGFLGEHSVLVRFERITERRAVKLIEANAPYPKPGHDA